MPREALIGIGAGLASATASLAFIAEIPFALALVYFSPLPLMAAGLGVGVRAAMIGSIAGLLATGAGGGVPAMLIYFIVQALPSLLLVYLALLKRQTSNQVEGRHTDTWFPLGNIVAYLGLASGVLLIFVAIIASNPGLSDLILTHLAKTIEIIAPHLQTEVRLKLTKMLTPLFPAAVATSWIIMILANGLLAQKLAIHFKSNLRPIEKYSRISLPDWTSWPLIGASVIALTASGEWEYAGRNSAMVFATPYFILGLSVLHSLANKVSYTGFLLVIVYLAIMLSLWVTLVVAGVGIVEQWIGIRNRTQNSPTQSCGGNES